MNYSARLFLIAIMLTMTDGALMAGTKYKMKDDPLIQKRPMPVYSIIMKKMEYNAIGTTTSCKICYRQSNDGEIKPGDGYWSDKFRDDLQWWGDNSMDLTYWFKPKQYFVFDRISHRSFIINYPADDPKYYSQCVSPIVIPNSWKDYLEGMTVEISDEVQINGKRFHRYSGKHPFVYQGKLTLHIDPETALLSNIREDRFDDEGNQKSHAITEYSCNVTIDPTTFEPSFPKDAKSVNIDLSQPAKARQINAGAGVGEVQLGMRRDSVVNILGGPDWIVHYKPVSDNELYFNEGMELQYDSNGCLEKIICHNRGAYGFVSEFKRFSGKTTEGISIGSSITDVTKTYGEPDSKVNATYSRYVYQHKHLSLRIDTMKECVDAIDVWSVHP